MLLLLSGCLADLAGDEYEAVEQEIGGAAIDAEQATLRFAVRACYLGAGDPAVELEFSPWIDSGDGEVELVYEDAPALVFTLEDKRPPEVPLGRRLDATAACETGMIVRFTLAMPGAGKSAMLAWVLVARALDDDPRVADGTLVLSIEPA